MIERLDLNTDEVLIQDKVNELVDFANGITKSMLEQTVIQLDREKVTKYKPHFDFDEDIEITEKMYTLDEVAELLNEYGIPYPCAFSLDINGNAKDNWCAEHCGRCEDVDHLNCWKHALENGWLRKEKK